jgi:hypothetical protein
VSVLRAPRTDSEAELAETDSVGPDAQAGLTGIYHRCPLRCVTRQGPSQ